MIDLLLSPMEERIYFHNLWCRVSGMDDGYVSPIKTTAV